MSQSPAASRVPALLAAVGATVLGLTGCGTAQRAAPPAYRSAPTAVAGGATTQRILPALDGVYVSDVTSAELLAHGSSDALDENFGHFVFVFDNGVNVQGQESVHACTWSVHSVTDDHNGLFTLSTIAAGGIAPNNANAKVGEPDGTMRWTLYRGVLVLEPISPEHFWIKPFHRVSRIPTLASFSRRCPPPIGALKPG